MRYFVLSASFVVATSVGASAAVLESSFIDFEKLPDGVTTPTEGTVDQPLRYEFNTAVGVNAVEFEAFIQDGANGGITEGFLGIAEKGAQPFGDSPIPRPFGFYSNDGLEFADTPLKDGRDDVFGEYFLTTELQTVSILEITYDTPIKGLNFDLGDVDGGQAINPGRVEEFTVEFRDTSGSTLASRTVTGNDEGAGDRSVINVSYESSQADIKSIFITGTSQGGERLIGIAFDNFDPDTPTPPSVVPVPPALPLLAAGLGALALIRRHRRTDA